MAMANSGVPLGQLSGSDATNALHKSIMAFNETTTRQTNTLIRLTWALIGLTVIMTIGVAAQIYVAVRALP